MNTDATSGCIVFERIKGFPPRTLAWKSLVGNGWIAVGLARTEGYPIHPGEASVPIARGLRVAAGSTLNVG